MGVSKTDKVPALVKLPGNLDVNGRKSGKSIPGTGNGMSKGPEVGRGLAYFRNRKKRCSEDG